MKKVVIVGAGTAVITVASRLLREKMPLDITIIINPMDFSRGRRF